MKAAVDEGRLLKVLAELVQINSINPTLGGSAGAVEPGGEADVADVVEAQLRDAGLEVDRWDVAPGRPNVVGILRGAGGGRSLTFNAHMDTVAVEGMDGPFSAERRDGRMYGRGTQDMKASLAAQIEAARILASGPPLAGDVVIAAVADEEHASIGTEALVERYVTDAAVVTEPTDLQLATAHKGFVWIDVETVGRAAHGSRPDEGVDANMHMARVMTALDAMRDDLMAETHPLLGRRSMHVGRLRGGDEPSVYADRCRMTLEVRTMPGDAGADVLARVESILEGLSSRHPTFEATARLAFEREALQTDKNAVIAETVLKTMQDVTGTRPTIVGATFWTDAALHAAAGTETVVLGPVGDGLHTVDEWVDLASVVALTEGLVKTARAYCGGRT